MPDYKITVEGTDPFPVTAPNPSAARNWAVRDKVKVETLTTRDAIEFGKKGVDLIDISAEPEAKAESGEGDGQGQGGEAGERAGDGEGEGEGEASEAARAGAPQPEITEPVAADPQPEVQQRGKRGGAAEE